MTRRSRCSAGRAAFWAVTLTVALAASEAAAQGQASKSGVASAVGAVVNGWKTTQLQVPGLGRLMGLRSRLSVHRMVGGPTSDLSWWGTMRVGQIRITDRPWLRGFVGLDWHSYRLEQIGTSPAERGLVGLQLRLHRGIWLHTAVEWAPEARPALVGGIQVRF